MLENQRFLDLSKSINPMDSAVGSSAAVMGRVAPAKALVDGQIIPELIARVQEEDHPQVVSSALVALARATDPTGDHAAAIHALLREHVLHSHQKVQESAILGLGLLGTIEGGDAVASLIQSSRPEWLGQGALSIRTRSFAAHALGLASLRIQSSTIRRRWASALVDELESTDSTSVTFRVAALQALGLFELDRTNHGGSSLEAEDAASSPDALAQYLTSWFKASRGRSSWVRTHAAVAAGRAASRASEDVRSSILDDLTAALRNRKNTSYVRTGAALALGEAANSGGAKADEQARKALLRLMKTGQPLESRFARMALVQASARPGFGEEAFAGVRATRKALIAELKQSRSDELGWSAIALGSLSWHLHKAGVDTGTASADALAKLGRRRKSDDSSAALGLGLALAVRGTKHAGGFEEHLLEEFDDISTPLRKSFMALALGLSQVSGAVDALNGQIKGNSGQTPLLWNASVGLSQMGVSVEPKLLEIVESSASSFERRAAIRALGQTAGARSVEALLTTIENESEQDTLRAAAVDALASICDPEATPWRDAYSHALPYFAATPTLNGNDSAIVERPW